MQLSIIVILFSLCSISFSKTLLDVPGDEDYNSALNILKGLDDTLPTLHTFGYNRLLQFLPPNFKFDTTADGDTDFDISLNHEFALKSNEKTDEVSREANADYENRFKYVILRLWGTLSSYFSPLNNAIGNIFSSSASEMEVLAQSAELISPIPATQEKLISYVESTAVARRLLFRAFSTNGDVRAANVLGVMAFYGNYSTPVRPKKAFYFFQAVVSSLQSSQSDQSEELATAHYHLAIIHSTNLGHSSSSNNTDNALDSTDQGRALLHFLMAAAANHTGAEMALGYRYHAGIGVQKSCSISTSYYYRVAKKVVDLYIDGPPGGRLLPSPALKLYSDEESGGTGGLYGPGGEQYAQRGLMRRMAGAEVAGPLSEEDTFEYYKYLADNGDLQAQYVLGVSFYWGTHVVPKHYGRAMRYLSLAANNVKINKNDGGKTSQNEANNLVAHSAAIVGRMYLRGEGVPISNSTAKKWFEKASKSGDALAVTYLAIMVLDIADGFAASTYQTDEPQKPPTEDEVRTAVASLHAASKSGRVEAQSYLGRYYFYRNNIGEAVLHLSYAMASGDIQAMFLMAENYLHGVGVSESCPFAGQLYRGIAEKGIELLQPSIGDAYQEVVKNPTLSTILYMIAAERGSETAQSNLAWMLSRHSPTIKKPSGITEFLKSDIKEENYGHEIDQKKAILSNTPCNKLKGGFLCLENQVIRSLYPHGYELVLWNRAGLQGNGVARVRSGDFFYYGSITVKRDYSRAVTYYRIASDTDNVPIAMWNLGYMYHHGLGVTYDQHLAKRYYDKSAEFNTDAWLPVTLSIWHLRITKIYDYFYREKEINLITSDNLELRKEEDKSAINKPEKNEKQEENSIKQKSKLDWTWKDLQRQKQKKGRVGTGKVPQRTIRKYIGKLFGGEGNGPAIAVHHGIFGKIDTDDVEAYVIAILCLIVAYLVYLRQTRFRQNNIQIPRNN